MKTRKELKDAYKQIKPIIGVFKIQNEVNGKLLIEVSTNIPSKWNRHKTELRFGSHRNIELQKDWNAIGEENFTFSVLSTVENKDDEVLDINKEIEVLKEMVLEELKVPKELKY